jgi:hypothetical protein
VTSKSERLPDIPLSCYPNCAVCSTGDKQKRVDRCYFAAPPQWRDHDIIEVRVKCHDEVMITKITAEDMKRMSGDPIRAQNFIHLLCDMATFTAGVPEERLPGEPSFNRRDAPWNF